MLRSQLTPRSACSCVANTQARSLCIQPKHRVVVWVSLRFVDLGSAAATAEAECAAAAAAAEAECADAAAADAE